MVRIPGQVHQKADLPESAQRDGALMERHRKKVQRKYKKEAKKCKKNSSIENSCTNSGKDSSNDKNVKEVKQTCVNILSTNAGDLRHKAGDLKNKL